jgi:hypothetical protein
MRGRVSSKQAAKSTARGAGMLAAWLLLLVWLLLLLLCMLWLIPRLLELHWSAVLQVLVLLLADEGCPFEAQVVQVGLAAAEGCRQCSSCTRIQPAQIPHMVPGEHTDA